MKTTAIEEALGRLNLLEPVGGLVGPALKELEQLRNPELEDPKVKQIETTLENGAQDWPAATIRFLLGRIRALEQAIRSHTGEAHALRRAFLHEKHRGDTAGAPGAYKGPVLKMVESERTTIPVEEVLEALGRRGRDSRRITDRRAVVLEVARDLKLELK